MRPKTSTFTNISPSDMALSQLAIWIVTVGCQCAWATVRAKNPAGLFGPRDAVGGPAVSLRRGEQRVDVLVAQLFLAVVAVDHQRGAAGGEPDKVIAELVDRLQLGVLLEHPEVGVALRLDDQGLGLG